MSPLVIVIVLWSIIAVITFFFLRGSQMESDEADVLCCAYCDVPLKFINESDDSLTKCPKCKEIEPHTKYSHIEDIKEGVLDD